jgi:hypothetical protein
MSANTAYRSVIPFRPKPARAAPGSASSPNQTCAKAGLLDEAAAGPDDRVLIIGASDPELLCDAVRHGCRTALEVTEPPAHPEPADIVVAPRVATEAEATAIALCARRALAAGGFGGRLALSFLGRGARTLTLTLAERLRTYGFSRITLRARAEGDLLLVCFLSRPQSGAFPARVRAR